MSFMIAMMMVVLAACSTRDPFSNPFNDPKPGWAMVPDESFAPHALPMFDGTRGTVLTWFDLTSAVEWADIVIIGEQHDDAIAHSVQLAIAEETLARFPRTAISMEMLERDEQPTVDAYLRGDIEVDAFIESTNSRDWSGKGSWILWYQPVIDAAKANRARVIAANSPRRLVRMARLEGYGAIAALPPGERALCDIPRKFDKPEYRARFYEIMNSMHDDEPPSPEALASGFRSQSLWDATMAASIMRARDSAVTHPDGLPAAQKVIHLVGQFHSDFEGGLVEEIAAWDSFAKVCVISVQRRDSRTLEPDDEGRAAIVIYSGLPPPPVTEPAPAPEAAPTAEPSVG